MRRRRLLTPSIKPASERKPKDHNVVAVNPDGSIIDPPDYLNPSSGDFDAREFWRRLLDPPDPILEAVIIRDGDGIPVLQVGTMNLASRPLRDAAEILYRAGIRTKKDEAIHPFDLSQRFTRRMMKRVMRYFEMQEQFREFADRVRDCNPNQFRFYTK